MSITITPERPDAPDATWLIEELESHLAGLYPSESRHGFTVDQLLRQGVDFFVTRHEGIPAGCGGIMFVGDEFGEIKRMYVRPQFRGLGLGRLMLDHLVEHSRQRGVDVVRLETGIHQKEAISLYERSGFQRIPPFKGYNPDPLSLFFEKRLVL